ncbi:MAG: hypothetical protein U0R19_10305 [Bryobacteraceae bacterium]
MLLSASILSSIPDDATTFALPGMPTLTVTGEAEPASIPPSASGSSFTTTTLTGALSFVENLDISPLPLDIIAVNYARATITGDIPLNADVPEPATSLLKALNSCAFV